MLINYSAFDSEQNIFYTGIPEDKSSLGVSYRSI